MYFLFPQSTADFDFSRIFPYKTDFMYMISPNIGLRLCNFLTVDGKQFKIEMIMQEEKDVFHCEDVKERLRSFNEILDSRLERFFITKKSKYIFFDGEEQIYLKDVFEKAGLSCTVEVYLSTCENFEKVELRDLKPRDRNFVINTMKKMKVRWVSDLQDYIVLERKANNDEAPVGFKNPKSEFMEEMQSKFPKLAEIRTTEQFKKYERFLSMKYHPDVSESKDVDLYAKIRKDLDLLKKSSWYKMLLNGGDSN